MIDDADIVAELRYQRSDIGDCAATEIERLRTELSTLRGLLREAVVSAYDQCLYVDNWYKRAKEALNG